MKLLIDYESSWRNSFLDGSNNEPLSKKGRKFIGSMTNLRNADNFIKRMVTLDTVMGVLCRLIGDQRKLYQARNETYGSYYFKDIESLVTFQDKKDKAILTNEMTYIRNMTGNKDPSSFIGSINTNHLLFKSDFSQQLWMVLSLRFKDLVLFILKKPFVEQKAILNPVEIVNRVTSFKDIRLDKLEEQKNISQELVEKACCFLQEDEHVNFVLGEQFSALKKGFSDIEYVKNNKAVVRAIYCSALYLQAINLASSYKMDGVVMRGFSVNGFTPKDFMKTFTGGQKIVWGNPYIRKERIKGQGEVVSMMTKASGQLEIKIDIDRKKAKEIKTMIENAGVSSFYLGKKGLAYVSKIRV
jgi:hypothetical protein